MNNEVDLKNLRTYEEDIKDALDNGNVTTTDIVLAEQKRRISVEKKEQSSKLFAEAAPSRPKHIPLIIGGVIFLLVGGAALYYAFTFGVPFFQKTTTSVTVTPLNQTSPVNPDSIITISTHNKTLREIMGELRSSIKKNPVTNQDGIVTFNLTKEIEIGGNGVTNNRIIPINTSDLFALLESRAPESLIRSFSDTFIIGLHQKNVPEPFILLQSESFDQSFAGMLAWEPNMIDDTRDIFFRNLGSSQRFPGEAPPVMQPTANSTTTQESQNVVIVETTRNYNAVKFIDLVLLNKDARAVQDFSGNTLFFYTFIDSKNLLITTNMQTLETVMRQLNIASLIR